MTGHSIINEQQNEEFISIMHTMIDDLDTISPNIDEHTYFRLVNGLQRLYNIRNTGTQTSSPNYETINQTTIQANNEVEITRILAQHYGRVYDTSGVLISNEPYPINDDINANNNNNENNEAHNPQAIYTSYVALYSNAFDYWNQPQHRFRRTN
jgi:hypothetical protein